MSTPTDPGLPTPTSDSLLTETLVDREQDSVMPVSPPPSHIGPWRLIEPLGVGGMGTVYLAERDDQEYERRAAIKIIRAGVEGRAVIRRFRAERQILASLDHPNIARMYDAGTLPDGRPYLVLEYVGGVPIDRYCRDHRLSMGRRLELFQKVCSAVRHAHQHLVIHRDLKPSNILVGSDGEPKLLDFGIAKLLDPGTFPLPVDDTQTGVRPMTPRYASPEQIRGLPVGTSSDVFSLGVLLYELITGSLPFSYKSTSAVEMDRVLSSTRPKRPSTAMVAERIGLVDRELRRGRRLLRGDLDNIVLKALREEPSKRYSSVEALQQDLSHLSAGRPVSATRDSIPYVAGKFLRRHRLGIGALAILLVTLAGSTWLVSEQASKAALERDRARTENARAHRMLDFLIDTFDVVDRNSNLGSSVTAKEILDEAILRIDQDLEQDADAQVRLFRTTGGIYKRLGLVSKARESLEKSLSLAESHLGPNHPQTLESMLALGDLLESMTLSAEAAEQQKEALKRSDSSLRRDHPLRARALLDVAGALTIEGQLEAAEQRVREALGIFETQPVRDVVPMIDCRQLLSRIRRAHGDLEGAEAMLKASLDDARAGLGEKSYWVAIAHQDLGDFLFSLGRVDEADPHYRRSFEIGSVAHSRSPTFVPVTLRRLGALADHRGDVEKALEIYDRSIRESEKLVAGNSENVLFNLGLVITRLRAAEACQRSDDPDRAEDHYRRALEPSLRTLVTGTQTAAYHHARVLIGLGRMEEARSALLELREKLSDPSALDPLFQQLDEVPGTN